VAASVGDALALASADVQRIFRTLDELGMSEDAARTTSFSIRANHDTAGRPSGFAAGTSIRIRVGVDRVGATVDALAQAVSDTFRLHGVGFAVRDVESLRTAARQRAVESARVIASELAVAAGGRLGALRSLSEGIGAGVAPVALAAAAMPIPPPMQLQPGDISITVEVTAVFVLEAI
jgi:uncharacterized protein YggE